ncbi:MAG: hypothetical protein NPINA01_28750 [Nitrospinaceae bacterium]|nr:MAG: hypothetical protein NPINA01_28750 [Nitrospinaceae bacterium]
MPDSSRMDAEKIKKNLHPLRLGSKILVFDTLDSTNDQARRSLKEGAQEGLVLIAESQTKGRGRMGRTWVSPPQTGIYLSVILKPPIEPEHLPQLTLLAGVAVVQAVNKFTHTKAQLKWPNDILLNGKKLSGILSEYDAAPNGEKAVIIGIGVNANHSPADFPQELLPFATSLKIETGQAIDRLALAAVLLGHLDREYHAYLKDGIPAILKKWMQHSDMFGEKITVTKAGSVIHGTATKLDDNGRLLIRTANGEELALDSGEVSLGSNSPKA